MTIRRPGAELDLGDALRAHIGERCRASSAVKTVR